MSPRLPLLSLVALAACTPAPMRLEDALFALEQAQRSEQGFDATQPAVEVSTDFTIGAALEAAAQELRDFWASQASCAEVWASGATLTVDYGDLTDDCTWNGEPVQGRAEIAIVSATAGGLEVSHSWFALGNRQITVDGGATVTWTERAAAYRVDTAHTFTEADGRQTTVDGDWTVTALGPTRPLLGAFSLDGARDWQNETGDWSLMLVGVEARVVDPLPYAGSWSLRDPEGRSLQLLFEQVDDNTFGVELIGLREPLLIHVNRLGQSTIVE